MGRHDIALKPEIAEVPRLLDWVERLGAAERVAPEIATRIALALEEAVTNVIRHAFVDLPPPHVLRVRIEVDANALTAEVLDNGRPFDPSTVPEPDLRGSIEERAPGGLGIRLMRGMTDRIDYRRIDGFNRLTLIKQLRRWPPA